MIGKIIKKNKGFTLIEIVVATGIFLIIFVIISDLAITFNRNPQELIYQKKLEREVDYCMEFLAQKIRTDNIDYSAYISDGQDLTSSADNPSDRLYLINQYGEHDNFYVSSNLYYDNGAVGENVNSANVVFDNIYFYIYPATDPFSEASTVNYQPRVTVSLQAHYTEDGVDYNDISIILQTTISSRFYDR
ncbi:MAG: type II secretion system protein [Patescibacteria group bacterium]